MVSVNANTETLEGSQILTGIAKLNDFQFSAA